MLFAIIPAMSDMNDFNTAIIEEFRANGGKVGGGFEGAPLLLLHTTGAKSGADRVSPLMYSTDGEALVIFASKAGAPDNPDWFHNIRANGQVTVEVSAGDSGIAERSLVARVTEGDERDRLWERQKADYPQFAVYEESTTRTIPVVVLEAP